jgi:hypothetical protein
MSMVLSLKLCGNLLSFFLSAEIENQDEERGGLQTIICAFARVGGPVVRSAGQRDCKK